MDEFQASNKKAQKRLKRKCQQTEYLVQKFARHRKLSKVESKTLEYLIGRGGLTRLLLASDLRATGSEYSPIMPSKMRTGNLDTISERSRATKVICRTDSPLSA